MTSSFERWKKKIDGKLRFVLCNNFIMNAEKREIPFSFFVPRGCCLSGVNPFISRLHPTPSNCKLLINIDKTSLT